MKEETYIRPLIQKNISRINELHERIHELVKHRSKSVEAKEKWSQACEQFHSEYDSLAFPGGYQQGLKKIEQGNNQAIEDALVFLEVRPYFFRSQYMFTKLIRLLKHVNLTAHQAGRFQKVVEEQNRRKIKGRSHA